MVLAVKQDIARSSLSVAYLRCVKRKSTIWISGWWKSSGSMSWRVSRFIMNSSGSMQINSRPEGNREIESLPVRT